jgi:iron complex outermembrane receptor protein
MNAFLLLMLLGAPADVPGRSLSGTVRDSAGAPLARVRIAVAESNRQTQTDDEGRYRLADLPSGNLNVTFTLIGFRPVVLRVRVDGDLVRDIAMEPTVVELPPIQVTATAGATSPLESPQPTAVLSGVDLDRSQAASLGETLASVAGVHNSSTGIGIGKPVVRGLTSNRVLVLDDGLRMETQQWGDEHGNNIETAGAERIEVIKGPASVLYGSDALGGVINVVQAPLPDGIGRSAFVRSSATLAFNSNNREPDFGVRVEGADGAIGYRAVVSGRTSSDVRTPEYVLWNSGNHALGGTAEVGYHSAGGNATLTVSQRNERVELTDEDPLETPTQRIATTRARLALQLPAGAVHVDVDLGYERSRRREFEDAATTDVALGLLSDTWTMEGKVHHTAFGAVSGVVGVQGLLTEFSKFGSETLIPNNQTATVGLYAFESIDYRRWNFTLGLRYDYRHLDAEQDDVLGLEAQTRTWHSIVGNVGALYRLDSWSALVLNVGRGYRAPSPFDLFSNGVHEGTLAFERGNPNLQTENSLNTDLAFRVQSRRVSAEVGGFVNLIDNFIYTVPAPGEIDPESGLQIFDVVQGNATLTGLEGAIQWHPLNWLHLRGTADFVLGQNTSQETPLPSMPPFRATWSAEVEGNWTGALRQPYLLVGGEFNARQTRLNPDEALFFEQAFGGAGFEPMAFTLVNVGTGAVIATGANPLRVDVQLRNLFNKAHAPQLSRLKTNAPLPGMGRALVVRLSAALGGW